MEGVTACKTAALVFFTQDLEVRDLRLWRHHKTLPLLYRRFESNAE